MALFQIHYKSTVMSQEVKFNVIIPDEQTEDIPWVLLLHGLSGNEDDWMRYTAIERYSKEQGYAIVMPAASKSWYSDQVYGLPFYTFITTELIDYVRRVFPLSKKREKTFVAGLSMGGYGSLKIGLNHTDMFSAIASLSGVVDIYHRFRTDGKGRGIGYENMAAGNWGPDYLNVLQQAPNNIYCLLDAMKPDDPMMPKLFLACGSEDHLYPRNEELVQYLSERGFSYEWYKKPGVHKWDVWDYYIPEVLKFFTRCREGKA